MKENPWVYIYFRSRQLVRHVCCHSSRLSKDHISNDACTGHGYISIFLRDWYRTKGAFEWMMEVGKSLFDQKMYDAADYIHKKNFNPLHPRSIEGEADPKGCCNVQLKEA